MTLALLILFPIAIALAIILFIQGANLREASYIMPLSDAAKPVPVAFDAAGVYVLYHEVVRGFHLMPKWRYFLWDDTAQSYITARWAPSRKMGGAYATRWRIRYLDVPHPGHFQLVVDGLGPDDEMKVIIGRYVVLPAVLESAAIVCIIAAFGAGFLLLASRM